LALALINLKSDVFQRLCYELIFIVSRLVTCYVHKIFIDIIELYGTATICFLIHCVSKNLVFCLQYLFRYYSISPIFGSNTQ